MRLLFSDGFLKMILIISLLGGIAGYFISSKKQQLYDQGDYYICKEFRIELPSSSILAITNIRDTSEYEKIVTRKKSTSDINFLVLNEGQRVVVYKNSNSKYKKATYRKDDTPSGRPQNEEFWIWHEFLK